MRQQGPRDSPSSGSDRPRRVPRRSRQAPRPRRAATCVLRAGDRGHRGARAAARHARQPAAPAPAVHRSRERRRAVRARRSSTRASCAPTGRIGWCCRSTASCASSSTRSTPTASCASSTATASAPRRSTPRSCRSRRNRTCVAIRGDIDAAASVADRRDGRDRREHPAGDGARRHLRRPDRLQQRPAAGRPLRGAVREVDPRGAVRRLRRTSSARRSWPTAGRTRRSAGPIPTTGKAAYYDEEGRSLKRFFLVSPLKFEPRITSGFSRSRLHPVHHTVRAHLGVDYGAPHGAAVVAVAVRHRRVGRAGPAAAATRCASATTAASRPTTCTCRRSRRASAPARASIRVRSSAASGRPAPRPGRTSTSGSQERRVRRSGRRAPPAAARRSDRAAHRAAFLAARDAMLRRSTTVSPTPRATPDALRAQTSLIQSLVRIPSSLP